jgi:hypothetical protein
VAIETVRRDCAKQIIDRWKSKLSVVDVWADSHCETVILHVRKRAHFSLAKES